tara:strand:- start:783 stop:2405 length:1623 start_codon:yes stop_codon:yes gene_type:complete
MTTINSNSSADIIKTISNNSDISWNLSPQKLTKITLDLNMGKLTSNNTLTIDTGKFTGRAPKDRFIVKDKITSNSVDWGIINQAIEPVNYKKLKNGIIDYLGGKKIFGRLAYACAEDKFKLKISLITEYPWSNLFGHNMFLRPTSNEVSSFIADWTILCAPGYKVVEPKSNGINNENFSIINFSDKTIIIGGTGYTGEIKKGIFSVLNFILPHYKNVLSMHCSANIGTKKDTSLFFGLSGTGKTTLSADPKRKLIGDDEHGWSEDTIFNFEGGCYAKCINLNKETEPDIYAAIKNGALLENIFLNNNCEIDFSNSSKTENTRVSYPIEHIRNIAKPSKGPSPKNIFFLTADAFGVLPPISKLSKQQAMYHFISGYTSKIAGTEEGINEPQATFSSCFGAPFMPLHPTKYASMLGDKIENQNVNVWLVNTGWSGGEYGKGNRIKLKYTRSMINAALKDELDKVNYIEHDIFKLMMPESCPGVPEIILNPVNNWKEKKDYHEKAKKLADLFKSNYKSITSNSNNFSNISTKKLNDISKGGPK